MSLITIPNSILKKLICSDCDNYLSKTPIFLKRDDGQICFECYKNLTLEETYSLIRCKIYEDLASAHMFPCKYHKYGCIEQFPFDKFGQHESDCTYRVYPCPENDNSECTWKGTTSQLYNHYKSEHGKCYLKAPKITFDTRDDYDKNNLVEIENLNFLLQVYYLARKQTVCISVVYLGKRGDEKFVSYNILISNGSNRSITVNCGNPLPSTSLKMSLDKCVKIDIKPLSDFLNLTDNVYVEFSVKVKDNLRKNMNTIIACRYCNIEMVPPIYRCALNHVTCIDCKNYNNQCTACRKKNCEFSRAIDLENLTYLNQFTCRWKGCEVQLECDTIRYHEYECTKREYDCPECKVLIGPRYKLPCHFRNNHKKITFKLLTTTSTKFTTKAIVAYIFVHNELFKVVIAPENFDTQTVFITYCGPPSMDSYFHYEVRNCQNFLNYATKFNNNQYKVTTSNCNYYVSNMRSESCVIIKFSKRKGEDMWIPFETSKKRKRELI